MLFRSMTIMKMKDGRTSFRLKENQVITYDPSSDSYMIQTEVDDRIHTSTIGSDVLDALHNRAWEGDEDEDDPSMPMPNVDLE